MLPSSVGENPTFSEITSENILKHLYSLAVKNIRYISNDFLFFSYAS